MAFLNVYCAAFQRQTRPDQDHISQIADRRSKRIRHRQRRKQRRRQRPQQAGSSSNIVAISFSFFFFLLYDLGLFLAGRTRCCSCCSPCLDKSSLQFVPLPSLSLSRSLSLSLHNCRLLIDRCNNVMDAQPAFDANNTMILSILYTLYSGMGIKTHHGMGIAVAVAVAMACCMAVFDSVSPHIWREPGP